MLRTCLERHAGNRSLPGVPGGQCEKELFTVHTLFGSVKCPITCLHYFFKISLWGGLPGSAIAVEGLRAFPLSAVLSHRIGLRSVAPCGFHERTISRGPTAKVCFQLPDNPRHFLWHRMLAIDPPVSLPPSLPGDASCVRPCAWS